MLREYTYTMPYRDGDTIHDFSHIHERPGLHERLFRSPVIEHVIHDVSKNISDQDLRKMFVQCFPNALDTTVYYNEQDGEPYSFIITGDIPAMWLRDSTNQIWPYLPFVTKDEELKKLFIGAINRQTQCILKDPYANAFEKNYETWERKYELDSLASFLRLSWGYWNAVNDTTPFTESWLQAVTKCLHVISLEQNTLNRENLDLLFTFRTKSGHHHPAIRLMGYGYPGRHSGLVRSVFRPSDDETVFPYIISSNAMTVVYLRKLAPLLEAISAFETKKLADTLAHQIDEGIRHFGIVNHKHFGEIYAYEVDGFGSNCIMDDPNIPSLLSLPYIGYVSADDPVYQHTRALALSEWNSFYTHGKIACGISSPHVGVCDKFWPMATIMQALTSTDEKEIIGCLQLLKKTHAGTYFIHESVHVDDPHHYTRHWFTWANSLFGELILKLHETNPELLKTTFE